MLGNVWELTQDYYGKLTSDAVVNPTGASSGTGRVAKGGSVSFGAEYFGAGDRGNTGYSNNKRSDMGFRLVKDL